jgi:5'-deoxynucleotidase YfbR-like HD superfamily hydrolase
MTHLMHEQVVDVVRKAISLMDGLLRDRIDIDEYTVQLRALHVDDILSTFEDDFKTNAQLVYYLDALMLLSSLQHEIEFQVAEYGANVALEDMRNLKELMHKFPYADRHIVMEHNGTGKE